jgi:hypothetical protein
MFLKGKDVIKSYKGGNLLNRKGLAVGLILLLFFSMNMSSTTSMTVSNPVSTGLFFKIICFGSIGNITFNENLLYIECRNLIFIEYFGSNESKFFGYYHVTRNLFVIYFYGMKFDFHGILKPHFICGYFIYNDSSKSFTTDGNLNQDAGRLGLYFEREFFIGSIKNLDVNGSDYSFDAVNLWRVGFWWDTGSRGFEIDHAKSDTTYCRFDYGFRGILKPDFICGIGRYI